MLVTAEDMYRYFLQRVRKERTVVITPVQWNEFINPIFLDWVKTKLPDREFTQKRIDDLQTILIRKRIDSTAVGEWDNPEDYMFGMYAEFQKKRVTQGEDPVPGKILRADQRVVFRRNPYRQPKKNEYMYFETRENKLFAVDLLSNDFEVLYLGYYKYPEQVIYSETNSSNGSFGPQQNKEVMDLAVTNYLEVISDQRIQSQPATMGMIPK